MPHVIVLWVRIAPATLSMDHIEALYADPRSHKRCLSAVFAVYSRIVQLSCDACITVCKQAMQVSLGLLEICSVCLVKYESRQAVFVFDSCDCCSCYLCADGI